MRAAFVNDTAFAAVRAVPEPETPKRPSRETHALRSIELFSGAGGLALGTHAAGFQHEMLIEWKAEAAATLQFNVHHETVSGIRDWRIEHGDIRDYHFSDSGKLDLLAGGPPCQPFSIAGKHGGNEDERNMIPEFVRVLRELAPRAFLMENVRGLLRPGFRSYFNYSLLQLAWPEVRRREGEDWTAHLSRLEAGRADDSTDLEYAVRFQVVNAADFGVPQVRHRVFVVGFRSDLRRDFVFPAPTHSAGALGQAQADGTYWRRHRLETDQHQHQPGLGPELTRTGAPLEPWRTVRDAIGCMPQPDVAGDGTFHGHRYQAGARTYVGHTGSPLDLPAKALKAGDHGVPGGENMLRAPDGSVRYFTVREAARLQTFPDEWRFEGAWSEAMRQIGNAVPVRLAEVVASSIARQLQDG